MVPSCSYFSHDPHSDEGLSPLGNLVVGYRTLWTAKGVCLWGELHYHTEAEWGGSDSIIKGLVFLGELSLITIIPLQ